MATLDDIQQFLTRTGKPVPPTTVERVPLRGPKVEDTIFSPVLSAIHELLTGAEGKKIAKEEQLRRMKQDKVHTGPTMKGVGMKEKVADFLGGRSQNVMGEGPVSAVANLLSGDLDPTSAAGASEAAIIPKLAVARTQAIVDMIKNNPQRFNTTAFPTNGENLLKLAEKYQRHHSRANLIADGSAAQIFKDNFAESPFQIGSRPWRILNQIEEERPDLIEAAGGLKTEHPSLLEGSYGDYLSSSQRLPFDTGIRINNKIPEDEQVRTMIHEFEHADVDRMGMLPVSNFDVPYQLRQQELSARGIEPIANGTITEDLPLIERYLSGIARLPAKVTANGELPLHFRPRTVTSTGGINSPVRSIKTSKFAKTKGEWLSSQFPYMNIHAARTGDPRYLSMKDSEIADRALVKALPIKNAPVISAANDSLDSPISDMRPLLEAILKLPRY